MDGLYRPLQGYLNFGALKLACAIFVICIRYTSLSLILVYQLIIQISYLRADIDTSVFISQENNQNYY